MTKSQYNVMTSMPTEPPKDMLILGDKLMGIYHELEVLPDQPGLQYRTCMHEHLVPGDGLEFNVDPDYDLVILRGTRDGYVLNSLIHCVRYGSTLVWNGIELYPICVGYVTPAMDIPEHHIVILVSTCELESEDGCCG